MSLLVVLYKEVLLERALVEKSLEKGQQDFWSAVM